MPEPAAAAVRRRRAGRAAVSTQATPCAVTVRNRRRNGLGPPAHIPPGPATRHNAAGAEHEPPMKSRSLLQGIAHSLAETFISRNNDIDGYWGIGMLYAEALRQASQRVRIDLLHRHPDPSGPAARSASTHYAANLAARLERCGSPAITAAAITLEFGTLGLCRAPPRMSYGSPFVCTVTLTPPTGRPCSASRAGHAAPHSGREMRSARADDVARRS